MKISDFSRKRINLNSLFSLQTYMHPISGARLYLSHSTRPFIDEFDVKYINPFFIFWVMPDRKSVNQYIVCDSLSEAQDRYSRMLDHKILPDCSEYKRDYQKQKIYRFDTEMMKGSAKYTLPQMKRLVGVICDEFKFAATGVDYMPREKGSKIRAFARTDVNEVCMQNRNMSIVLHEMAHIINGRIAGDVWMDHGPSFSRVYMYLLERYMHFPPLYLEEMAAKMMIDVTKPEDFKGFQHFFPR